MSVVRVKLLVVSAKTEVSGMMSVDMMDVRGERGSSSMGAGQLRHSLCSRGRRGRMAVVVPRPAVDADSGQISGQSQGGLGGACNDSGQQDQQTLSRGEEYTTYFVHVRCRSSSSAADAARPIASIAVSPLLTTARWCGAGSTRRAVHRERVIQTGESTRVVGRVWENDYWP